MLLFALFCVGWGSLVGPLTRLQYRNAGTVKATDSFAPFRQACNYLEPENVTKAEWSWAVDGSFEYMYQVGPTPPNSTCKVNTPTNGTDLPGDDYKQITTVTTAAACGAFCCQEATVCRAYTFAQAAPAGFGPCLRGKPCCYLKEAVPTPKPHPGLISGTISGGQGTRQAPPSGIRSAPPLGGLATGTVELRGDGRLTAWTIENQSPGGAGKFSVQDDAIFTVYTKQGNTRLAKAIRTHPSPVDNVDALTFHGSPPTSRLDVTDSQLPIEASLFGWGTLRVNDMETSHRPAAAFSLLVKNSGSTPLDAVSFMFVLPLQMEQDTHRPGTAEAVIQTSTPADCVGACIKSPTCQSWTWQGDKCTIQKDAPLNSYLSGAYSGIRGTWSATSTCLTVDRPGTGPMHGNLSLCGGLSGLGSETATFATDTSFGKLYDRFVEGNGTFKGQPLDADLPYGAISLSLPTLAPGESTTLSFTLGWYFPGHNYLQQNLGNYYNHLYKDSADAATTMAQRSTEVLADIAALQEPFFNSTMPEWLQDTLVGTLHHFRSAMWFADGRWRQWEAYDCVNMDSIHNDGERHIPYIMLFPNSTRSKIKGWGDAQEANGMLPEQLACGCMGGIDRGFEHGCGRVMSDVSSMYIVYILELYKWGNDLALVHETYPRVKRAAEWHISTCTEFGVPAHLQTTYDILGLNHYDVSAYSSAFHLLAMQAAQELAVVMNDTAFATVCQQSFVRAKAAFDKLLWNQQGYWNAYSGGVALMSDSLYAQVLAYTLGMPTLPTEAHVKSHLAMEIVRNDSPYGMMILTGRTEAERMMAINASLDETRRHLVGGLEGALNVGATELDVWMMAPADHATLLLRLEGASAFPAAMKQAEKPYKQLREVVNDLWNAAGIVYGPHSAVPGNPYITSHYGYYMTVWHTALALSGQVVDLPKGSLVFNPTVTGVYRLPVLMAGVTGLLGGGGNTTNTLTLTAGSVTLQHLAVGSSVYPGVATLKPGVTVSWH